jgi:carboxyl-terminal processing protease
MKMTTPRAATVLIAALLATPVALLAADDAKQANLPTPPTSDTSLIKSASGRVQGAATADQATAAKLAHGLLSDSRYAYRPRPLDDALSADMYKRYLESLDSGKQFFTAQDIARFDPYKTKFDEAIKDGKLDPAYAIFAVYRQRFDERVAYARNLLKQDIFTFTGSDRFEYDREDAPWPADTAALDALWKQSVRNDWLRLKLAGKKPEDIRKTLDKRYLNMAKGVAELKGEDVFQTFVNSYANSIDPHTDYFTPRTADNFNMTMSLSLEGIGAVLQKQDDVVAIREIVPGGPAGKSHQLKPGDRVVAVGQGSSGVMEDVIGWRIDDVVSKIRGAKGTRVRLDVIPAEATLDSKPQRIVLVRDKVRLEDQAAKSEVISLPGTDGQPARRVGVIKLPGFYQDFEGRRRNDGDYASATRDVAKLLLKLRSEKVDGVVLDLRNNGGGSLTEAIELTGLFIDRGPVVQVRESGGKVSVEGDEDTGRRSSPVPSRTMAAAW